MKHLILIVEPDPAQGERVASLSGGAGYATLVVPDASEALRRLYQERPAAVLLSDRLPVAEVDRLSERIALMTDLPLIVLTEHDPLAEVAQRLAGFTSLAGLGGMLDGILKS